MIITWRWIFLVETHQTKQREINWNESVYCVSCGHFWCYGRYYLLIKICLKLDVTWPVVGGVLRT